MRNNRRYEPSSLTHEELLAAYASLEEEKNRIARAAEELAGLFDEYNLLENLEREDRVKAREYIQEIEGLI